jgi:LuxR family maltose regulon positive regulatory protein
MQDFDKLQARFVESDAPGEEVAKELASEPTPPPRVCEPGAPPSEQREALLLSKLAPPRLPLSLVERPGLLKELDAACTHALTLVSASAGSGKTTLLSAWAASFRQDERRKRAGCAPALAWLSLEALDNSPIRFWGSCLAALRTCLPRVGETALALLHSPEAPPLSTCLSHLINEIAQESRELILVLDDYHVITDQAIHEAMLFLLEHLPTNLHLVLATRVDPEFPLSRWRVRGQLLEIRSNELHFTREEAADFLLRRMGLPLSGEDIARLHHRTEGWIAGLYLAALSLRKRQDLSGWVSDFAGSHRYLLDYVQQDILAQLPVPLQQFLLQTAILTRMNAAACQAVAALPSREQSQEMLEEVERANLFVVPLDDERQWYRYHDLFREALLARLQARQPQLVPLLHTRAARFYEVQGEWAEAIAHALAAPDYPLAASMMEQTVEQFWLRGEAATMAGWVLALPEQTMREHARLALTAALYLLNPGAQPTGEQRARVHTEVRQLMARVENALRQEHDEVGPLLSVHHPDAGAALHPTRQQARTTADAGAARRLRLLHLGLAVSEAIARGEFERVSGLQQEIQELDRDEEVIWQMIPLASRFFLQCGLQQEGALLIPRLLAASEQASRSGSHFATVKVRQWLAEAALKTGKLRLAYEESRAALALIEEIAGYALLKGYFEQALAAVCYHWNRLEEARGWLRTALQDAATWQQSDMLLSGYSALILVELARGDRSAAEQALREIEQQKEATHYRGWLSALRARWWLAQGQVREASDWAAGIVFPEETWESSWYFAFPVVIQVYFAQHRWQEALSLLERWRGHLERPDNSKITLTYLAQVLVALHQAGKSDQAREVAVRLFALTEPEGYLRVYLDEGEPMKEALLSWLTSASRQLPQASSPTASVSRLLAAFEQEAHRASRRTEVATLPDPMPSRVPQPSPAASALGISLTRREQEVLRLLVAGQTYAEMAEALVVSPNTIKSQVSSIYRKLGVSRRAEAIALTRRLRALS